MSSGRRRGPGSLELPAPPSHRRRHRSPPPRRAEPLRRVGRRRDAAGQATVELALVLPLVCGLFLLLVQVALVARSQILLTHATREAARAVALEPVTPTAAALDAGRRTAGLDPDRLQMTVEPAGEPTLWSVRSRYRLPLVVPLLSLALGEVTLNSRLVVRAEPG